MVKPMAIAKKCTTTVSEVTCDEVKEGITVVGKTKSQ